jgi:hypothetical protein
MTDEPTLLPSVSPSAPDKLTVSDFLECDGEVTTVGGVGEALATDVGFGGSTPDEALRAFLDHGPFVIPVADYEPLGTSGDRYAYGYRADGEVKVVVVVSPRYGDLVGAVYATDELRTCPESEFGAEVEFGDGRRIWTHVETGGIITDLPGPSHCEWQSARMLHIEEDGRLVAQYLRDPDGVFDHARLLDAYAEGVELPDDASDSGYRSPDGLQLWFTESNTALYVVTPDTVERWPRAEEPIGCV